MAVARPRLVYGDCRGVISDDSNLISLRVALFNNYPKRDRIFFVSRRMFGMLAGSATVYTF